MDVNLVLHGCEPELIGTAVRHATFNTATGQPNRKMCSLYLSLMEKAGVKLTTFGDSKEQFTDIQSNLINVEHPVTS